MTQGIQRDTQEPGSCRLAVFGINGQYQEFCLDHTVVSMLQLAPQHFRIERPHPVELISLGGDLNALTKVLFVHLPTHQGQFHADGGIMGVIQASKIEVWLSVWASW
jgi:hypothetical protein